MTDVIQKIEELEAKTKEYGFYWHNADAVMQQIHSEYQEIEELLLEKELNQKRLQEEIGDLLHAVMSLCFFCGFSNEITLKDSLDKFEKRFNATKELASKDGLQTLHGKSFDQLMQYWKMAKKITG